MDSTTRLTHFEASGGFLRQCRIEFSPQLTCIIGARGTCKSTLIESIRFALNSEQEKVDELLKHGTDESKQQGRVRATLGEGNITCKLIVSKAGGGEDELVIRRELGGDPKVFRGELLARGGEVPIPQIEIYSQGDLLKLAKTESRLDRIALVDRRYPREIPHLLERRSNAVTGLQSVASELRNLRNAVTALRAQLKGEAAVQERLKTLEKDAPEIPEALGSEQKKYQRRQEILGVILKTLEYISDIRVPIAKAQETLREAELNAGTLRAFNDNLLSEFVEKIDPVMQAIPALESILQATHDPQIDDIVARIRAKSEERDEKYRELRRTADQASKYLRDRELIEGEIRNFAALKSELSLKLALVEEHENQRAALRATLQDCDARLHAFRFAEVEKINEVHRARVILSLRTSNNSEQYRTLLTEMLEGSGVRQRELVVRDFCSTLSPRDLVDWAERGEPGTLASALGRDLAQVNRILSTLSEHERLYELEGLPPEVALDISMFDHDVEKPVESLSSGQKASALLPLVLRDLPYPLVIDQPEDDIDNQTISEDLVSAIRKLKALRQLIFVTHNANIPVLADAETVIVMTMDHAELAGVPATGTVEQQKEMILGILEGGSEAFNERQRRYGDLLKK